MYDPSGMQTNHQLEVLHCDADKVEVTFSVRTEKKTDFCLQQDCDTGKKGKERVNLEYVLELTEKVKKHKMTYRFMYACLKVPVMRSCLIITRKKERVN